jgi:hypothetical protein
LQKIEKNSITDRLVFYMTKKSKPSCSSCGSLQHLNLVTLPSGQEIEPMSGRILVYCYSCRTQKRNFDISIPLKLVDRKLFNRLYDLGVTESEKSIAENIVFGAN